MRYTSQGLMSTEDIQEVRRDMDMDEPETTGLEALLTIIESALHEDSRDGEADVLTYSRIEDEDGCIGVELVSGELFFIKVQEA